MLNCIKIKIQFSANKAISSSHIMYILIHSKLPQFSDMKHFLSSSYWAYSPIWVYVCTQWRWVWVGSKSGWWTGRPGCYGPWDQEESDMTEQLNCTVGMKILTWLDQFFLLLFFLLCFLKNFWEREWLPIPVFLLRNFLDRGIWPVRVYGVTKNETWLSD